MITVKVLSRSTSTPQRGIDVYISASGVRDARTDGNGEAKIDFPPGVNGKLVVKGEVRDQGELQAFYTIYI
jgi:hypothetical protein